MTQRYPYAIGCAALLAATATAAAQPTPITRPIRLIVPYVPGGGTDTLARLLAPAITAEFGQQVVVDNRAGGNSTIGTQMIARAAPDGHTIGMIDSAFVTNPALVVRLPYDTLQDFAPVTLARTAALVLLVNSNLPVKSVRELVAYAKERPGKLSFGSAGTGSGMHLAGEQLRAGTLLDLAHIPYKGGGQVMIDLLGGQITLAFATAGIAKSFVESGRLRPLAVTSAQRIAPILPDVMTFAEAGLPAVNAVTINGLIAPAGTPRDYIDRLNAAVNRALKSRELISKLPDLNYEAAGGTPEEFAAFIRTEIAKWQRLVREAGIRTE